MDAVKKSVYVTILGRNPEVGSKRNPIVVHALLPRLGEHDFKWCVASAIGKEYGHYAQKLNPKANPVNVHVYGKRKLIEDMAERRAIAVCELELVVKKLADGREYILANLYLTKPWLDETHGFKVVPAPKERPWFVYTTESMHGSGIQVRPL